MSEVLLGHSPDSPSALYMGEIVLGTPGNLSPPLPAHLITDSALCFDHCLY